MGGGTTTSASFQKSAGKSASSGGEARSIFRSVIFPIILAEFVREERFLALPDAIRKMTSFAAQRLGLPDRGLLRDGFKADVVVFNPKTVKAPATRTQPKQFPIGIDYVVVNGQVVVDNGQPTGVLAGRALRRGRAST